MYRYCVALSLVLTLGVLTRPMAAQTPVFKIEDNTGTVLLLVNDDGTITLPTAATNGYVLTTDANGNATWMPASGGLTLPFTGTTSTPSPAFDVENTGGGAAGRFTASSNGVGLVASSNGGPGVSIPSAGGDGVRVSVAGSPSGTEFSSFSNGVEVAGAEGYGVFVGHSDLGGMNITTAGADGVRVITAGSPTTTGFSPGDDGFEIRGASGHGLFVGHADGDGVHVASATGKAGYFEGDMEVTGKLTVNPSGGVYGGKSAIYQVTNAIGLGAGGGTSIAASCNDVDDLPLHGFCHPGGNPDVAITRREAGVPTGSSDWSDTTQVAAFRCDFENQSTAAASVAAIILCIAVN